jgi:hypothetical protein
LVDGLNSERRSNLFFGPQFEQIRDGAAFGSATHFGDLIDFFHVTPARLREEHQEIMSTSREKVLNEIPLISGYLRFACAHSDDASATAPLGPEFTLGGPFDVATVGNSNNASLSGYQILDIDFALAGENLSEPLGPVLILNSQQFFLDDGHHSIRPFQNVEQIINLSDDFRVLIDDFLALESGELVKTQVQDLVRLMFAKNIPAVDQPGFVSDPNADLLNRLATELVCEKLNLCFFAIRGPTNNVDKIVEIG